MSIIDGTYQQILALNQKKEDIITLKDELPDAPYHIFSINAMIRDAEMRYERLIKIPNKVKCSQCDQSIEEHSVRLNNELFCNHCVRTISQVMNTSEMEERNSMKAGTVKQDCNNAIKFLQKTSLVRKSNKCWLVHESLIELFYHAGRSRRHLETSWVDEMENHIKQLQNQLRIFNELGSSPTGTTLQVFSLNAQINDYEHRLKTVQGGIHPFRCSQCNGWIRAVGLPILLGHFTLCHNCKTTIERVMTASEIETRFNFVPGRIRKDIHRGLLDKYQEMGLLRQSGSIWIMHVSVIKDYYFPEKQETPVSIDIPPSLLARSAAILQRKQDSGYI
ncbi:hypothetical protein [Paenibacillus periandrae]|uniref:hypothetical protein n=1 Tax=Paenibacillus periandrae TaxID=1761741 RepID=UPI001F0891E5|nr:hypothetical protein [Paenibacillus periandrae]